VVDRSAVDFGRTAIHLLVPVCGIAVSAAVMVAALLLLANGRRLQKRLGQTAMAAADVYGVLIMDGEK
jgi:hypothetical protein